MHFSVEFFPTQTQTGAARLKLERDELAALKPDFFSVTYGAGGTTRGRTFSLIKEIALEKHNAVPHLSCIGASEESLLSLLTAYQKLGVNQLVALRGDLPSGMAYAGEFRYAIDLMHLVKKHFGNEFALIVAAYPEYHPEAQSPDADLNAFVTKAKAGATGAITQYFFNADAYFHFVEGATQNGVNIPIIPGIMPIMSFAKLARFSDNCGAEIPRWMRRKFESYCDDSASIRAFGLDVVTILCAKLLEAGAPGLHFYSMNQADLILEIIQRLKSVGLWKR